MNLHSYNRWIQDLVLWRLRPFVPCHHGNLCLTGVTDMRERWSWRFHELYLWIIMMNNSQNPWIRHTRLHPIYIFVLPNEYVGLTDLIQKSQVLVRLSELFGNGRLFVYAFQDSLIIRICDISGAGSNQRFTVTSCPALKWRIITRLYVSLNSCVLSESAVISMTRHCHTDSWFMYNECSSTLLYSFCAVPLVSSL